MNIFLHKSFFFIHANGKRGAHMLIRWLWVLYHRQIIPNGAHKKPLKIITNHLGMGSPLTTETFPSPPLPHLFYCKLQTSSFYHTLSSSRLFSHFLCFFLNFLFFFIFMLSSVLFFSDLILLKRLYFLYLFHQLFMLELLRFDRPKKSVNGGNSEMGLRGEKRSGC